MYHKDDSGDDEPSSSEGDAHPSEADGEGENPPSDAEGGSEGGADMYDSPADMFDSGNEAGEESTGSDGGSAAVEFDEPFLGGQAEDAEQEAGTFYVKNVEDIAVTLHEVNTGQIFTVVENPGLERREIIEATLVENPPLNVAYLFDELQSRRSLPVEESPEPPTTQAKTVASEMDNGEAIAIEREGEGEIHVITVDSDITEATVEEVVDDEMTYKNAARYGVGRVEVRSDEAEGIVSIRYLP